MDVDEDAEEEECLDDEDEDEPAGEDEDQLSETEDAVQGKNMED